MKRGGGGKLLTLMKKTSTTTTNSLYGAMVLPDVELLYILSPLRRGVRRGMGQIPNTCFKASARSTGIRRSMCVPIFQKQMRPKIKCGSEILRRSVTVFHSICIVQMTFSDKYIIVKSLYIYIFMPSMQHYC